ncbi:diaminopimelate aminotransferase [Pontibacillus halophilus JSM 076056 = DSM 19796]|uniref:Aminotransferase n=1 Tax=Pontibacillus halophilus JSM 076056 = DSM 19796 TaxID=1385510 RepID=A0A0A5GIR6_9BACI|nr:aminotransferase class I/II-fold pyridoxal phosphate-dependent enzyme [Pontibacillus halophilus]KGX91118.1 diaminopimelate aminotransferase [Pontibacillus halophilus JSM 076056 = DSM 19796]
MKRSSMRVQSLPPYLFSIFHERRKALEAKGIDVIDLGIGAPDLPPPDFIVDRLVSELRQPEQHRYSPYTGCDEFREAVASYYKRTYDVTLDPKREVLTLIGSKEGIASMMTAWLDPGDVTLIPNPGYPVYRSAVHLAGGEVVDLPLLAPAHASPNYEAIREKDFENAKMMVLNYPGNPTGATIDIEVFLEAVTLCKQHDVILAHDAAYGSLTYDGYQAPSILQVDGAKEIAVEFGSLSKTFNMAGWRIGYVVGNEEVIKAIATVKSNIDTSQFLPIQFAAAEALRSDFSAVREQCEIYKERRDYAVEQLRRIHIDAPCPKGTFFIWAPVPDGATSREFSERLLEAGVVVTPGEAFGTEGRGYFRISLSTSIDRLTEAFSRMEKVVKEMER